MICGIESQFIFGSRRVYSEEGSSVFSPVSGQLGGGRVMYYLLGITVGNCLKLFLCPFLYFGRLHCDRHGEYVTLGGRERWRKSRETGRLSPSVI
jgi:hypothetical protein